jgi:hypothetical protein
LNFCVQNEICKYFQNKIKNRITINAKNNEISKIISLKCDYFIETIKILRNNKKIVSRVFTSNNFQIDINNSNIIDEFVNRNVNVDYNNIISCFLKKKFDTISKFRFVFKFFTNNDRVTSIVENSNVDSLKTKKTTRNKKKRIQYENEKIEKRIEKLINRIHTCDVNLFIVQS